jgi:23S rRNA (cytosine1962-C5)-methyltransferase
MSTPGIKLKAGREKSLLRRHPFVFSGAIDGSPDIEDGAVVRVLSHEGVCLGRGHYQASGSIRVRMLTFDDGPVDGAFWKTRVDGAFELRCALGLLDNPQTDAFRLIHGEGDGLPGLIADWYAGNVVLQAHSAGMSRALPDLKEALENRPRNRAGAVFTAGEPGIPEIQITENGHRFVVNPSQGQKTGFYLDQRDNRKLAGMFAAGRNVLNIFSYSGAFAVYALKGGAKKVCSVESSGPAGALAARNIRLNGLDETLHEAIAADAFEFLKDFDPHCDLIILDPPAFAKHMSARHAAIQAYRRINAMAMRRIAPGGLLFTFSCSQVVTPDLFRGAVLAASVDAGRTVRILYQLHQPPDHPVSVFHPEGEYLKGFALSVA